MYIVRLTYKCTMDEINENLEAHREFLEKYYLSDVFLASGPQVPREGGVILVSGKVARNELEKILKEDPFQQKALADYNVIEFNPVKHHPALSDIL